MPLHIHVAPRVQPNYQSFNIEDNIEEQREPEFCTERMKRIVAARFLEGFGAITSAIAYFSYDSFPCAAGIVGLTAIASFRIRYM